MTTQNTPPKKRKRLTLAEQVERQKKLIEDNKLKEKQERQRLKVLEARLAVKEGKASAREQREIDKYYAGLGKLLEKDMLKKMANLDINMASYEILLSAINKKDKKDKFDLQIIESYNKMIAKYQQKYDERGKRIAQARQAKQAQAQQQTKQGQHAPQKQQGA